MISVLLIQHFIDFFKKSNISTAFRLILFVSIINLTILIIIKVYA
jgi:hypothetical protein